MTRVLAEMRIERLIVCHPWNNGCSLVLCVRPVYVTCVVRFSDGWQCWGSSLATWFRINLRPRCPLFIQTCTCGQPVLVWRLCLSYLPLSSQSAPRTQTHCESYNYQYHHYYYVGFETLICQHGCGSLLWVLPDFTLTLCTNPKRKVHLKSHFCTPVK